MTEEATGARILVVDDEQGPRASLKMILAADHTIHEARDGSSALEILRTTPIDLVTIDLNMPGMRGDQLMRTIREEFPHVEVIVITGYGSLETAVEGLRYGICDYLRKPFDVVQVSSAVSRALARRFSRTNLLSFLEGIGDVLGKHRDAGELLGELEGDGHLQRRLRAVLEEPAVDPTAARDEPLGRSTIEFLEVLAETIECRDAYMRGHARRVAFYASLLAERLCLSAEERENVRLSAFLHDLGKVGVPSDIVAQRSNLSPEQRVAIEQHACIGERLVKPLALSATAGAAIRHHHERWDGAGYPDGLREDAIPLASRIVAIADAFDAMTSERPHRGARSQEDALEVLAKQAGSQFDPALVKEFLSIVRAGACETGLGGVERQSRGVRGESESVWPSALQEGGS
ncbi:MAG: HD domain-containing phosphohydrolase [Myxococcota bacterium]